MKKIIGLVVLGIVLIYGITYYFRHIYVPKGEEFDIKYSNLIKKEIKGQAKESLVELTSHGINARTNLYNVNDQVEYLFDIINDGTIDAELKMDPIYLKLDMYLKKHIEYKITDLDGNKLRSGDIIKAGETKTVRVTITCKNTAEFESNDSQFYQSNVYLYFVQKR